MKSATFFLLCTLLLATPPKARAFGPEGHRIVVNIAMQYLSPEAKKRVLQILGATTPEDAAVWMDEMRDDTAYKFMKSWHFINIEKGKSYQPGKNNIVWALEKVYGELQRPEILSKKARKEDLMILIHLMGDLHQPLHVGYASDRGGNEKKIDYKGYKTDLHRFWDSNIIWNTHITADACMKLSKVTSKNIMKVTFAPNQFLAYMNESRSLLPKVYAFDGETIDQNYVMQNKQVIMLQLLRAGQRLGIVLQQLFGVA